MPLSPYLSVLVNLSLTSGTGVSEPLLSPGWTFPSLLGRDMHGDFVRSAPSFVPGATSGCLSKTPAGRSNGKPCGR